MGSEAKGGRNRAIWGRLLENQESQEARVAVKQSHGTGSGCLKILESVKSKSGNQSVVPLWKVETQLEVEVRKWGFWRKPESLVAQIWAGLVKSPSEAWEAEKILKLVTLEVGNWKEDPELKKLRESLLWKPSDWWLPLSSRKAISWLLAATCRSRLQKRHLLFDQEPRTVGKAICTCLMDRYVTDHHYS